jgi:hypothetical protein
LLCNRFAFALQSLAFFAIACFLCNRFAIHFQSLSNRFLISIQLRCLRFTIAPQSFGNRLADRSKFLCNRFSIAVLCSLHDRLTDHPKIALQKYFTTTAKVLLRYRFLIAARSLLYRCAFAVQSLAQ